ncbi:MAG: TraR/DksA family transcriptional regulator [Acidimicrobiales bacterium]
MPGEAPTVDYRRLLEEERSQLLSELSELGFGDGGKGLAYDSNFADSSQVTAERSEAEGLAVQLRESLADVAHALSKLADGTYGTCEECQAPIDPVRLDAMPSTRFCIKHAVRH